MSRVEALRRARELRAEFREKYDVFQQSDYYDALLEKCADLAPSALEGMVAWTADRIDKDATQELPDKGQRTLFDLEGDYKDGQGGRIAKYKSRIEHFMAALQVDDDNRRKVEEANERKHRELELLRPYWPPGGTKQQAVAAYREANPDEPPRAAAGD